MYKPQREDRKLELHRGFEWIQFWVCFERKGSRLVRTSTKVLKLRLWPASEPVRPRKKVNLAPHQGFLRKSRPERVQRERVLSRWSSTQMADRNSFLMKNALRICLKLRSVIFPGKHLRVKTRWNLILIYHDSLWHRSRAKTFTRLGPDEHLHDPLVSKVVYERVSDITASRIHVVVMNIWINLSSLPLKLSPPRSHPETKRFSLPPKTFLQRQPCRRCKARNCRVKRSVNVTPSSLLKYLHKYFNSLGSITLPLRVYTITSSKRVERERGREAFVKRLKREEKKPKRRWSWV